MNLLDLLKQQRLALVISGRPGCGKSLLARQLAEGCGNYSEVGIEEITRWKSGFQHWLDSNPNTVIVDGDFKAKHLKSIVTLIESDKIEHNRKGKKLKTIATPTFIFCTNNKQSLKFGAEDRRFYVIDMDTQHEYQ